MIVKKVVNPLKSSPKAVRIQRLTDYIRAPETESSTEKCIYSGTRGFLFDTPVAQTAEMLALSEEAVRSPDTITHYVLSWREGEIPTKDQIEEAVDILLKEMDVRDHQVVYGLHADTDNHHLHVAINRVHPETVRVIKINRGWDIEAAHRAGVRIEHAQGWLPDANKRYRVRTDGKLERTDPDANTRPRKPSQLQLDAERRTGEPSHARMAIDKAAPLIAAARSWAELHASLEKQGMRYERAGSGAQIRVGSTPVKASRVARTATLKSLQARLGSYQPPPEPDAPDASIRSREPNQQQLDAERWIDEPSQARIAIETAAPLIAAARSWAELHASLDKHGMRYERAGSGARIRVGTIPVKASRVARTATLKSLQARLGPYQPLADEPFHDRMAIERAASLIPAARSWPELYTSLKDHGMRYELVGSGAQIWIGTGTTPVKASRIARTATLKSLQARLGPYQPPPDAAPAQHEDAAPIIAEAANWAALHAALAERNLQYRRAGSGAHIVANGTAVKATSISRAASLSALQNRLGPYQPSTDPSPPLDPENRPGDALLDDYRRAREAQRSAQAADRLALQQQHDAELAALKKRQAKERHEIFEGKRWRGHGALLNALRKEVAAKQRAEREDLRKKQRRALEAHRQRYPAWPSYLDWLLKNPEASRHLPGFLGGSRAAFSGPYPVPGYDHEVVGRQTIYRRRGSAHWDIAFRDTGSRIYIHAPLDDEASVLAALQLAARKWGTIKVTGPPDFLRLSVRLAVQHGIDIGNPELQDELARERIRQPKPQVPTATSSSKASSRSSPTAAKRPATRPPSEERKTGAKQTTGSPGLF